MNEKNCHHSPRATLAVLGLKLQALGLLAPIREKVKIAQKTIKHNPLDKPQDAFITILAGARGLSEINTRLRADPALQRAFGRLACADQSVVQATLNACTSTNVAQMMLALDAIFQQHSLDTATNIVQCELDNELAEDLSKDETIVVRLGSGDRFRFEDENGVELATVEVGIEGDPQALAIYTYGRRGKLLGYLAIFK
jgi:hypothetical protein